MSPSTLADRTSPGLAHWPRGAAEQHPGNALLHEPLAGAAGLPARAGESARDRAQHRRPAAPQLLPAVRAQPARRAVRPLARTPAHGLLRPEPLRAADRREDDPGDEQHERLVLQLARVQPQGRAGGRLVGTIAVPGLLGARPRPHAQRRADRRLRRARTTATTSRPARAATTTTRSTGSTSRRSASALANVRRPWTAPSHSPTDERSATPSGGSPDGAPVLGFHGTSLSRLAHVGEDAPRAAGVRLILVDRPGYGLSDLHPGGRCSTGRATSQSSRTGSASTASPSSGCPAAARTRRPVPTPSPIGSPPSAWSARLRRSGTGPSSASRRRPTAGR